MSNERLAKTTAKNIIWNYGTFAAGKAVIFIATAILARILVPDDFGLLAIGLIAINYLDILSNFGVGTAFIYQQEDVEKASNTAFVLAVASGILLTLIAFLIAPWVAVFFNEPRVTDILRVLAFSLLIANVGSIHQARFMKELDFKRRSIPEVSKAIVKGGVSVGLAMTGYGVWSLVWGQLAGGVTSTVLSWVMLKWIPRWEFDRKQARVLIFYGANIILIGLQATIFNNIDYLLIGRRMNPEQLGYYTLAFRLPELIVINFVVIVGQALFPTYAKKQSEPGVLREGFLTVERYVALLIVPIGIGMIMIAPEFVVTTYSDTWEPSITVMQILSLYAVIYALSYNAGDIFKALGRPGILNRIAFIRMIVAVPVLWYAAGFTINHVAVGQLAVNLFVTIFTLGVVTKVIAVTPRDIFNVIWSPMVSGVIMAAALMVVRMQTAQLEPLPRMLVIVPVGVIVYPLAFWLMDRPGFQEIASLVKLRRRQSLA